MSSDEMALPATASRVHALKHLAFVLGCVWLGAVLYAALLHVSNVFTQRNVPSNPFAHVRYLTEYFWLPWILFAPVVAALSRRLPLTPGGWLWPLGAHVLTFLAISVLHGLGVAYFYHYLGHPSAVMATYEPWQHSGHFLFGDDMFLFNIITYAVLAANLNIGNFHQIVRRHELDAIRLNETLAQLRLQTLRMQINPHFLFNSLNAVAVLVRKNERERAVEMIGRISSFLRRTLEGSGEQCIPLERELEMVAEYLAIAKLRYGERLTIVQHCDEAALSVGVPAMLLQPLIENAVTHGIAEKPGPCTLAVLCRCRGDRLVVTVSDDGVGCRPQTDSRFREGVGLKNVRLRLQQIYGDDHAFALESRPGEGTRVTIDVPMRTPSAAPGPSVAA